MSTIHDASYIRIVSSLIMSESMHTISVTLHVVEQTDRVVVYQALLLIR